MTKNAIKRRAYTIKEVSEQTTLSQSFIRNEIREGNLKVRTFGRRKIILETDLLHYLEREQRTVP